MDLGFQYNPFFLLVSGHCTLSYYSHYLQIVFQTLSVHLFLVPFIPTVSNFLAFFRYSSFEHVITVDTTNVPNNKTTYGRYNEQ